MPAVDLLGEYESIRGEIDAAVRARACQRLVHPGRRGGGVRGGVCGLSVERGAVTRSPAWAWLPGTDALQLALMACDVGPGDEVITVAHTAVATATAITLTGATPVFVDIDPPTYTMDPDALEAAITPRTKAVIPVHLYGHPAEMDAMMEVAAQHGLRVIEDCAQAHGARYKGRVVGHDGRSWLLLVLPDEESGRDGRRRRGGEPGCCDWSSESAAAARVWLDAGGALCVAGCRA